MLTSLVKTPIFRLVHQPWGPLHERRRRQADLCLANAFFDPLYRHGHLIAFSLGSAQSVCPNHPSTAQRIRFIPWRSPQQRHSGPSLLFVFTTSACSLKCRMSRFCGLQVQESLHGQNVLICEMWMSLPDWRGYSPFSGFGGGWAISFVKCRLANGFSSRQATQNILHIQENFQEDKHWIQNQSREKKGQCQQAIMCKTGLCVFFFSQSSILFNVLCASPESPMPYFAGEGTGEANTWEVLRSLLTVVLPHLPGKIFRAILVNLVIFSRFFPHSFWKL